MSLEKHLQRAIRQKLCAIPKTANPNNIEKIVKREVPILEAEGKRGTNLELAYEHLKIIRSTSVKSERAFSRACQICTKIRSRLNDDSLDTLCFLRFHFQNSQI